jgi:hypothetical protein
LIGVSYPLVYNNNDYSFFPSKNYPGASFNTHCRSKLAKFKKRRTKIRLRSEQMSEKSENLLEKPTPFFCSAFHHPRQSQIFTNRATSSKFCLLSIDVSSKALALMVAEI